LAPRSKWIAARWFWRESASAVKAVSIAALIVGVAISVALVIYFGAQGIGAAFIRLGALGFIVFCFAHAPVVAVKGVAWRYCLPASSRIGFLGVVAARVLRDGGAEVLPLSELGGFVIGARAAVLAGATSLEASASTLLDLTTEAVAQLAFVALGVAALYLLRPDATLIRPAALMIGLLTIAIVLAASVASRNAGLFTRLRAMVSGWLAGFGDVDAVFKMMGEIARRRSAMIAASLVHLVGWLGVAAEGWLGLRLLGAPISFSAALALESLLFAARSIGFFSPNGFGVQEGAYALLAPLLGLDIADALALSLIKRARDIVIGAPALLLWQRAEAARLWRRQ
jgi:glycosyltransferase 2 family protein